MPKKLVVIGAGYIGLEMGSVWLRLGSEVQVVEYLDYITPGMDREVSDAFLKILQKQGMQFNLSTKVIIQLYNCGKGKNLICIIYLL